MSVRAAEGESEDVGLNRNGESYVNGRRIKRSPKEGELEGGDDRTDLMTHELG